MDIVSFITNLPKLIFLKLIRFYQIFISPMLGSNCIYTPTCSNYTYQAIERFGIIKGGWMGAKRVARCTPFHEGGYDPVPEKPDDDHEHHHHPHHHHSE